MVAQHTTVFATTASEPTQHVAIVDEMKQICPHRLMCTSTHAQRATSLFFFACIALHASCGLVAFLFLALEMRNGAARQATWILDDACRAVHLSASRQHTAMLLDMRQRVCIEDGENERKLHKTPGGTEDRSRFQARFKTEAAPMDARARQARRKKTMDSAAARAARLRKQGG